MLLLAARQEVTKKRAKPFPLGSPLAGAKTVGDKRLQCFGEDKHIQTLRLQVKETCKHGRRTQHTKQKILSCATHFVLAGISSRNGKAKILASGKPICGVGYMPRRWRILAERRFFRRSSSERRGAGSQGACPLADFLSPFLCSVTKKGHECFYRAREAGRGRRRSCLKFVKNSPAHKQHAHR